MESAQTLHGVTEGEYLGLVIRPPGAIVPSYPHNLLMIMIQDDEPSRSMALLRATIELDMKVGTFDEPGADGKMKGPLQGGFGGLHIFKLLGWVLEVGLHLQFIGCLPWIGNHELGFVAA
jgi:hypothetical protein